MYTVILHTLLRIKPLRLTKMKRLNKLHYTKATYKAALRCLYAQLSICLLIEILNAQEKN